MKEMIKRTAACLLFAGLAAGMLYGAYRLLHFKSTDGCYPAEMFYQQEENTVDVLCLGSSHTYTNINPAICGMNTGWRHMILPDRTRRCGILIIT